MLILREIENKNTFPISETEDPGTVWEPRTSKDLELLIEYYA